MTVTVTIKILILGMVCVFWVYHIIIFHKNSNGSSIHKSIKIHRIHRIFKHPPEIMFFCFLLGFTLIFGTIYGMLILDNIGGWDYQVKRQKYVDFCKFCKTSMGFSSKYMVIWHTKTSFSENVRSPAYVAKHCLR